MTMMTLADLEDLWMLVLCVASVVMESHWGTHSPLVLIKHISPNMFPIWSAFALVSLYSFQAKMLWLFLAHLFLKEISIY